MTLNGCRLPAGNAAGFSRPLAAIDQLRNSRQTTHFDISFEITLTWVWQIRLIRAATLI